MANTALLETQKAAAATESHVAAALESLRLAEQAAWAADNALHAKELRVMRFKLGLLTQE